MEDPMRAVVPCRLKGLSHNALRVAKKRDGSTFIRRSDELADAMDGLIARLESERGGRTGVGKEDGPVAVELHFMFATDKDKRDGKPMTKKPDIDNLVKSCLDCLVRAHWLADDAQVTQVLAEKQWKKESADLLIAMVSAEWK